MCIKCIVEDIDIKVRIAVYGLKNSLNQEAAHCLSSVCVCVPVIYAAPCCGSSALGRIAAGNPAV